MSWLTKRNLAIGAGTVIGGTALGGTALCMTGIVEAHAYEYPYLNGVTVTMPGHARFGLSISDKTSPLTFETSTGIGLSTPWAYSGASWDCDPVPARPGGFRCKPQFNFKLAR
ncbi:MAG: hypothetical protein WDO70_02470 [Alphaproteobacteria bacterium]